MYKATIDAHTSLENGLGRVSTFDCPDNITKKEREMKAKGRSFAVLLMLFLAWVMLCLSVSGQSWSNARVFLFSGSVRSVHQSPGKQASWADWWDHLEVSVVHYVFGRERKGRRCENWPSLFSLTSLFWWCVMCVLGRGGGGGGGSNIKRWPFLSSFTSLVDFYFCSREL